MGDKATKNLNGRCGGKPELNAIVSCCRILEVDHEPEGWPAIKMKDVSALCDEVERLWGIKEKQFMSNVVTFRETSTSDCFFVIYEPNGKHFGMLNKEVDGFFYFAPQGAGGVWPSNVMREIADKLDELNYFWEQQVAKDCGS